MRGSPAHRCGFVFPGDILLAVDGSPLPVGDAAPPDLMLAGSSGGTVELLLQKGHCKYPYIN